MKTLEEDIIHFFKKQSFVIVSTISEDGSLNNSCKGIVKIDKKGLIYLLDLYKGKTYTNLKRNPNISITTVNEHRFEGYCLKGKAKKIEKSKFDSSLIKAWEDRITTRITQRLLKNIYGKRGHQRHPEAILPKPEYLILMEVKKIVDLTPYHIKKQSKIIEGGKDI